VYRLAPRSGDPNSGQPQQCPLPEIAPRPAGIRQQQFRVAGPQGRPVTDGGGGGKRIGIGHGTVSLDAGRLHDPI